MNCTLLTFPQGYGIRVKDPLNLPDFKMNDVRPAGSGRLTWYMQYAARYQKEPPSEHAVAMVRLRLYSNP
jgi:hypothetical protein